MGNISYRCPECGAEIGWSGAENCFHCEYCDGKYSKEELRQLHGDSLTDETKVQHAVEIDKDELEYVSTDDGTEGTDLVKYKCSHCQAELITERATAATVCVYCGKPVIMTEQVVGGFSPKYVIPFEKTQDEAMAKFKAFMDKPLTPKDFKDAVTIDKVQGIYIPFWLYSGKVKVKGVFKSMQCIDEQHVQTEKNAYVKRRWNCYSNTRVALAPFVHVPADGSNKTDDKAMQSIEPYDFSKLQAFDTAYLSGYLAERYDEESDVQKAKIEERIKNTAHDKLVEQLEYDRVKTLSFDYKIKYESVDYALLPTWLLYCTYNGTRYLFAMNGQTGKFIGNLPIDKLKAALIAAGTFVATAILCWGILL